MLNMQRKWLCVLPRHARAAAPPLFSRSSPIPFFIPESRIESEKKRKAFSLTISRSSFHRKNPGQRFQICYLGMSAITSNQNQEPKTRCPTCGCVGKNPTYEKLNRQEIDAEMKTLVTGVWQVSEDYMKISRTFKCRNWQGAVDFINQASVIAESEGVDHHPDIHLTMYRVVEVVCWTHATGGLTKSG
jgi:pterin-4a-carbinolamine dehydratase